MNFVIPKNKLLHLLYLSVTISEKRSTMPLMAHVKMVAKDDTLTVSATNLEVSFVGKAQAQVLTQGDVTVNTRAIYDLVRELPDESVNIRVDEHFRLYIESGSSKFDIPGTSVLEFPETKSVGISKPLSISASVFSEMLEKTNFAICTDETRHNLNGIFVHTVSSGDNDSSYFIRMVATDGHRLAMIDRPSDGFVLEKGVILPRKGVQELKKFFENYDGIANIGIEEGFFTVQCNDLTIGIRLVDGSYPDYMRIFPKHYTTSLSIDRDVLLGMMKRMSLINLDKVRGVRFSIKDNELEIFSSSPDYGNGVENVSIQKSGDDQVVGFSGRYVVDVLSAMSPCKTVSIFLSKSQGHDAASGPGVFKSDDDELFSCIIMPMRFE